MKKRFYQMIRFSLLPDWKTRIFEPGVMLEDLLREAVGANAVVS